MKKSLLLIFLFVSAIKLSNAQTVFQKTYGGMLAEGGRSVQQTPDGGFILCGFSYSFGSGNQDVYLVKTNASGVIEWTRTFGDSLSEGGACVKQTSDGGFIVAGSTNSFGAGNADVYLLKTDASGNLQWSKAYGGTGNDYGNSVVQTNDQGFAIAGHTDGFGAGSEDVYLVKTDSSGNLQWTKTFGGNFSDISSSILQTSDDGFVISGGTLSFGAGGQDVYVVKTDSAGTLQWTKTIGGALNDGSIAITQNNDGGFSIAGGSSSFSAGSVDLYLARIDASGSLQWAKSFGGTLDEIAYAVQQTNDEGFVITGFMRSFATGFQTDACLLKTDSSGTLQWTKTFGGSGNETGYAVQQTSDNGYILLCNTDSIGSGVIYLVKTDSTGSSGCIEASPVPSVNSGGVEGNGGTEGMGGMAFVSLAQTGTGGSETTFCISVGMKEDALNDRLLVYPNPFSEQLRIESDEGFNNAGLTIFNSVGQEIKRMDHLSGSTIILQRENLPTGIYFLVLEQEGKSVKKKLLIYDK